MVISYLQSTLSQEGELQRNTESPWKLNILTSGKWTLAKGGTVASLTNRTVVGCPQGVNGFTWQCESLCFILLLSVAKVKLQF